MEKGEENRRMLNPLRIYEIFVENKAALHAGFRDHVARTWPGTASGSRGPPTIRMRLNPNPKRKA